jgi:putative ABC transport system permease protein
MVEVFRESRRRSRRGVVAWLRFWSRTSADLAVTLIQEWWTVARESGRSGSSPQGRVRVGMDVRSALREMGRSPGSAGLASLTLGIGLAASLLMLVLVRDVLMRPLPFSQPERLVRLLERNEAGNGFWPSFPNIVDWREQATVLEGVAAAEVGTVKPVLIGGTAVGVPVARVSRGFFDLLGIEPRVGRNFTADENQPGGEAVAIISEELWRGVLGSSPLGELTLDVGRDRFRVIGVLPSGFRFLGNGNAWLSAGVWLPLERSTDLGPRQSHGYHTVARLRGGVGLEQARQTMQALAVQLREANHGSTDADFIDVQPLLQAVIGSAGAPLRLLLIAAFVVLIIACLNVAAVLLARGLGRSHAFAVRTALGARRWDLIRLQLMHAVALAVPGTLIGILGAWGGLIAVRSLWPSAVARLDQASIDPAAVALCTGIALIAAMVSGVAPALVLSGRRGIADPMRTHGSTSTTRSQRLLWDGFVGGQIALTLVLLAGSSLLTRSLMAALAVDTGYDTGGVAIASIALPDSRFEEPARRVTFYDEVLRRLRGSPGISAAGLVSVPPDEAYTMVGRSGRGPGDQRTMWIAYRIADPGYFETVHIPVEAGGMDVASNGVLIDRELANGLWQPGAVPIGERVDAESDMTVTGVTGSTRLWNQQAAIGAIYVDYHRRPESLLSMYVVARGTNAAAAGAAIRAAVRATDPIVPVDVRSLNSRLRDTMADRTLMLGIAGAFAGVALLLAIAGVYALVSQAVARRHRESGIRLVLGARPSQVRRRVLGVGLRGVFAGIPIGVLAAIAAGWTLRSQLFQVSFFDAFAFAVPVVLLLGASLFAAWLPARRATRVDPVKLLRDN